MFSSVFKTQIFQAKDTLRFLINLREISSQGQ
jgi:hypothetical protein